MTANVYHNPRCGKSREALAWLEAKNIPYKVVRYMDEPLTYAELDDLLQRMDMDPMDLVRTQEPEWKEHFASNELEDEEVIYAMIEYPKLMQRPIVAIGDEAVVARPAERIAEILG
jgi:arsenate reductase (glutaredoxin)